MLRFIDRTVLSVVMAVAAVWPTPLMAAALTLQDKVELLIAAYPEALDRFDGTRLYFKDGGPPLPVDDGRAKTHPEKLDDADIEDQLEQLYPQGPCAVRPPVNSEPGRIRAEPLMMRLYGASAAQVRETLTRIDWFGRSLQVTTRFGVAARLERVRDEIAQRPDLVRFAADSSGTFNWRPIAGTRRLSVHSFAAAIDLDTKYADYWQWAGGKPGNVPRYENKYPLDLVEIFERHGFIWGGRWYHYDTMHFEYRPELLAIGKAAGVHACR